jgi:hypothetical protein
MVVQSPIISQMSENAQAGEKGVDMTSPIW